MNFIESVLNGRTLPPAVLAYISNITPTQSLNLIPKIVSPLLSASSAPSSISINKILNGKQPVAVKK